jgi:hypothetical protein
MFFKNVITVQLNVSVTLQFCACLNDDIMHARSRPWSTADILEGLYIRIDKIALLIPSLSLHRRVGPTRQVFFNLPPKEGSWVRVRV